MRDGMYVAGAFHAVVKAYQYKYDIQKTPDVLSKNISHPYKVYEYCTILHDDDVFDEICEIILAYLRLTGINVKHRDASIFIAELDEKLNGQQLSDLNKNLNAKGVVGKLLGFLFDHLTKRSIARFESVEYKM